MHFMRKRTVIPLLIAIAVFLAIGLALYWRAKAPPEAARLLPECDAMVYVKLKTLRAATHFDASPIARSPYFQQFVDATGIVPERDLDEVALAMHRVPTPLPHKHGDPVAEIFTSEVFVGRFDGQRLTKYLASTASSHETFAGVDVYTLPVDGETVRVAQLAYDIIAISNMPAAEQIHSMVDRSRASGLSSPGSSLLAAHYRDVPQLPLPAQAWGIGHIGLPFSQNGYINVMGLQLPLPEDTDLVASLRYSESLHLTGSVHLRIEEIAPDEDAAQHTVETLTTLLSFLRGLGSERLKAQPPPGPAAVAMHDILSSVTLVQHGKRAELDASATADQLKAIGSAHNPTAVESPAPAGASIH
jgi:hypothetical protein